jgi:hypothetical protein
MSISERFNIDFLLDRHSWTGISSEEKYRNAAEAASNQGHLSL